MIRVLHTILFFFAGSAFAVGPFGKDVSLKSLNGIDQKGCEAGKVLEQEFAKNGINFIDGKTQSVWSCKGVTYKNAQEKRCPFPNTVNDIAQIKCYSDSKVGPAVCISGARSEKIDVSYADSDIKFEVQPRFNELVVVGSDSGGYRQDRTITMDASGCAVEAVQGNDNIGQMNNGSTNSTFDKCSEKFDAMLGGGAMYPGQDSSPKFCDRSNSANRIDAYWTQIKQLNTCFEDIPNFLARYKSRGKPGEGAKGGKSDTAR